MKKLSDALKTLIGLEREAYGLAEQPDAPSASVTINQAGPTATMDEIRAVIQENAATPKV
jgi:hypothetical protein